MVPADGGRVAVHNGYLFFPFIPDTDGDGLVYAVPTDLASATSVLTPDTAQFLPPATETPTASAIPKASSLGKLAWGWFFTQEAKTASFNASVAYEYVIGTLGAACTVTLPATHAAGDRVRVSAAPNANTYNVTIDGNGDTINGSATLVISTAYQSVELVSDGTNWRVF
jgi:hypothetical protein